MGVCDPLATTSVCAADDGNFGCLVVTQLGVQMVCLFVLTVSPSQILWTAASRTAMGLKQLIMHKRFDCESSQHPPARGLLSGVSTFVDKGHRCCFVARRLPNGATSDPKLPQIRFTARVLMHFSFASCPHFLISFFARFSYIQL